MANLKRVPLIGDLAKLIGFLQGNFRDFRLGGEKLHGMIRFDNRAFHNKTNARSRSQVI